MHALIFVYRSVCLYSLSFYITYITIITTHVLVYLLDFLWFLRWYCQMPMYLVRESIKSWILSENKEVSLLILDSEKFHDTPIFSFTQFKPISFWIEPCVFYGFAEATRSITDTYWYLILVCYPIVASPGHDPNTKHCLNGADGM